MSRCIFCGARMGGRDDVCARALACDVLSADRHPQQPQQQPWRLEGAEGQGLASGLCCMLGRGFVWQGEVGMCESASENWKEGRLGGGCGGVRGEARSSP
eukprot:366217-Chlamydomonas_euryale.AAC.5